MVRPKWSHGPKIWSHGPDGNNSVGYVQVRKSMVNMWSNVRILGIGVFMCIDILSRKSNRVMMKHYAIRPKTSPQRVWSKNLWPFQISQTSVIKGGSRRGRWRRWRRRWGGLGRRKWETRNIWLTRVWWGPLTSYAPHTHTYFSKKLITYAYDI